MPKGIHLPHDETAKLARIVDFKMPRTGYIYHESNCFYFVRWHNGVCSTLHKRRMHRQYKGLARFEINRDIQKHIWPKI